MFDQLLMQSKKSSAAIFELDYSGQDVGGTVLRDKVTGLALQAYVTNPNGSIAHGVIDHPTYGRVFQFNGYSYYKGTGALTTLPLSQIGYYQIDVEMLNSSSSQCSILETGNYDKSVIPGTSIILGQVY